MACMILLKQLCMEGRKKRISNRKKTNQSIGRWKTNRIFSIDAYYLCKKESSQISCSSSTSCGHKLVSGKRALSKTMESNGITYNLVRPVMFSSGGNSEALPVKSLILL